MSVQVKSERKDGILIAMLIGHIDSSNAASIPEYCRIWN